MIIQEPLEDKEKLDELRQEYNAAVANNLIGKARSLSRQYRALERKLNDKY